MTKHASEGTTLRAPFPRRKIVALIALIVMTLIFFFQSTSWSTEMEGRRAVTKAPLANLPTFNRTKVALLVETREKPTLIPILLHYMATTPPDWPFHVMHSTENAHVFSSRALRPYIASGRLSTSVIPPTVVLNSAQTVSQFLTSRWIWEQLEAEHIFFWQLDAMLCSNSDQSIDSYLHYDWVGAPWPHRRKLRGGNGGFSMRRKSRMLRCIDSQTWQKGGPNEDVWFSQCMATFPDAVLPTYEQSMEWAIEAQESPRFLGIHKPWGAGQCRDLSQRIPA
ncbi:hypothetical protein HKX48_005573 [Thoreauomyces humboldtii]|nr:hypothetical protein HKX48_005573 [Thoreauomyces humboldtii]